MKDIVKLKGGDVILERNHIIGLLKREEYDMLCRKSQPELEIILFYDGCKYSQTLTYKNDEDRQNDINLIIEDVIL